VISPVFATPSHVGQKGLGLKRFRTLARHADIPIAALGGINAQAARRLAAPRPAAFAAIGAFAL